MKAIEEFKSSDDFQKAVESLDGKYFGEGFNFCKRQLAHHHPNIDINIDDMGIDHDLLEEEEDEAKKKGKTRKRVRRKAIPVPYPLEYLYIFVNTFSSFLVLATCNLPNILMNEK